MSGGLVGRDRELVAAQAFLADVPNGARGLLVEGDAGIGKTAVWRAVLEEAAKQGCRVLRCVGDQAEARLSFVGLSDLVGAIVDDRLGSLPAPQREALERALVRRGGRARRAPDPKTIGVGLRSLLVGLAQAGPVVIAVDDVQWLDGATARALAFVARRLDEHAVGILVTARVPLTSPDPLGLERALGPDRFARLRLGPLDLGALGALLELRLGHRHPRPVLHRIAQVSDGNPLFALEISRVLGPAPSLRPGAPLPVPDSLRQLVAGRIGRLSPDGRQSLLAASALSHPSAELVEQASSASGLASAEEAGLLRVDGDRVMLAHPLYASAVYGSAASRARRALHRRLAELVDDPEEQARHLALAASPPDEAVAAALEVGAEHARARGAWDSAAELLEQARAFTSPGQPATAREREVRAAEHHIHAGDRPRARALLERLLADATAGQSRGEALRLLAEIRYNEDSFADAARLLEEALHYARDPALRVTIELSLTYVCCNRSIELVSADEHAGRALEQAVRLGNRALLGEALAVRAVVDFMLGRGIDRSKVERALALEDRDRLLPLQMRPSMIAALLSLYEGRVGEARAQLTVLRRAARDSGDESDLALVLVWLAWLETMSGAFAVASSLSEEAAVHAVLTGSEAIRGWGLAQRAFVRAHRGEAAGARADAAEAAETAGRLGFWLPQLWSSAALGLLELSRGDAAAAWSAVRPLTETVEEHGIGEPLPYFFAPLAIEALTALGELDRAERLLERFDARTRALDRVWLLAPASRCRGLLLAARGDLDGADRALQRALIEHRRVEMPFELARTLLVHGRVRRRRREKRSARESFDQALALFKRLGARSWAELAQIELAQLRPQRERGGLTRAEQRATQLAAEGLSNKEIASTLFVSVYTVEAHLSHAYAKLGIHSRGQLTHRLAAKQ